MSRDRCMLVVMLTAALGCLIASADAQDPRGVWSGTIHTDQNHHLVLRVDGSSVYALRAIVYTDDRGSDLPVDTVTFKKGVLDLSALHGAITLRARLNSQGDTLRGNVALKSSSTLELHRTTEAAAWSNDTTAHKISRIQVADGVSLEVLDWGGSGPSVLLLTGLGNNAHIYDTFAPKLAAGFHVYGLTRRGAGASTWPDPVNENYTATQLGQDVLAVMVALQLNRPLVVGHSIAGEELSYLGNTHPERVSGLVYLDAAYAYAYFDPAHPDFTISLNEVRRKLATVRVAVPPQQVAGAMTELATHDLPTLEALLKEQAAKIAAMPGTGRPPVVPPPPSAFEAIINGEQKFEAPRCPVLAIFAFGDDPQYTAPYAKAFAAASPRAEIVRLQDAKHYVFLTNEADVLERIRRFVRKSAR